MTKKVKAKTKKQSSFPGSTASFMRKTSLKARKEYYGVSNVLDRMYQDASFGYNQTQLNLKMCSNSSWLEALKQELTLLGYKLQEKHGVTDNYLTITW